jgi:hypothetical protein
MTEEMARTFERRVLTPRGELAGPLLFREEDLPTYIIGVVETPVVADPRRDDQRRP